MESVRFAGDAAEFPIRWNGKSVFDYDYAHFTGEFVCFFVFFFCSGNIHQNNMLFSCIPIQAGDKSLATVVAHEISHSWTGNLVTNANYEHFWLNEGFTMFLEGKIAGRMFGKEARDFHAIQGLSELQDCVCSYSSLIFRLPFWHSDLKRIDCNCVVWVFFWFIFCFSFKVN